MQNNVLNHDLGGSPAHKTLLYNASITLKNYSGTLRFQITQLSNHVRLHISRFSAAEPQHVANSTKINLGNCNLDVSDSVEIVAENGWRNCWPSDCPTTMDDDFAAMLQNLFDAFAAATTCFAYSKCWWTRCRTTAFLVTRFHIWNSD